MSQLQSRNATVLGISTDSVESHKRFVDKEHLNFPLLADTDKKMTAAYGVLGPAGFANRVTFVIGPDGIIREIDRAVNYQFNRQGTVLTTRHAAGLAMLLSDWKAKVGQPVPNFSAVDVDGKTVSLIGPGKRVSVVVFLSEQSRRSQAYKKRLRELAADPAYRDVYFLGLDPNGGESNAAIKAEASPDSLGFAIARDPNESLADHFGATVTPTVWVVDSHGNATYSGAIDDSVDPAKVKVHYLKDALDAMLGGKKPAVEQTTPSGDPIQRSRKTRSH